MPEKTPRTGIVRTRTGCFTCRRRRIKCDESKPECRACTRLGLPCEGYHRISFRDDTNYISEKVITIEARKWDHIRTEDRRRKRLRSGSRPESLNDSPFTTTLSQDEGSPSLQVETPDQVLVNNTPLQDASPMRLGEFRSPEGDKPAPFATGITYEQQTTSSLQAFAQHTRSSTDVYIAVDGMSSARDYHQTASMTQSDPSDSFPTPVNFASPTWNRALSTSCPELFESNNDYFPNPDLNEHGQRACTPTTSNQVSPVTGGNSPIEGLEHLDSLPPIYTHLLKHHPSRVLSNAIHALLSSDADGHQIGSPPSYLRQSKAVRYYSTALSEFAAAQLGPELKLALLVLFGHYEIQWGTFLNGVAHMKHADAVIDASFDDISATDQGKDILRAWYGLRSQFSMHCAPYGSQCFAHFAHDRPIWARFRKAVLDNGSNEGTLLPMLIEGYRCSVLVLLERLVGTNDTSATYRQWKSYLHQLGRRSPGRCLHEAKPLTFVMKLQRTREELDTWHAGLPHSDLPFEKFTSTDMNQSSNSDLYIRPLYFNNHASAMRYVRYACAQLYCSQESLDLCTGVIRPANDEPDPWSHLILRITAGLSLSACYSLNTYTIGILHILHTVAERTMSLPTLFWLDAWAVSLQKIGAYHEAGMPIGVFRQTVQELRMELEHKRRKIVLLYTGFRADEEKMELYGKETASSTAKRMRGAVVSGVEVESGKPFSALVDGF